MVFLFRRCLRRTNHARRRVHEGLIQFPQYGPEVNHFAEGIHISSQPDFDQLSGELRGPLKNMVRSIQSGGHRTRLSPADQRETLCHRNLLADQPTNDSTDDRPTNESPTRDFATNQRPTPPSTPFLSEPAFCHRNLHAPACEDGAKRHTSAMRPVDIPSQF